MKKYWLYNLLVLLLVAACGGSRVVSNTSGPSAGNAVATTPVMDNPEGNAMAEERTIPIVTEEEVAGPYLPPEIPETQYQPYIRRAETPAPAMPFPDNSCHLAVEVRNYDGVDGCGILLETDEGVLFMVGATPRGDPLETGTRISIGYELMRDFDGQLCGNADAVIRITCKRLLRVSSGLPRPVVCEAYEKPSKWLVDLAKGYGATYITRFPWKEGRFVYLLESPYGQYLYDCRGYLICQPRKNCLSFIENFRDGVVIYEG